jgi:methylmalonyl-CoA/ethylmalonyl-CoA epimerase
MMLKKIRHIGIMANNLDRAIEKFKGFGLPCTEITEIQRLGVKIAFFPIGESMIEMIYTIDPEKTRGSVVQSQKGTINHICFEVDDIEATIKEFEKNGAKLVEGYPKPGAHGRVAFFYPETTEDVLIEICQV